MTTAEEAAEAENAVVENIRVLVEDHQYSEDDIQRIVRDALDG